MMRPKREHEYKSLSPHSSNVIMMSLNLNNAQKNQSSYLNNMNRMTDIKQHKYHSNLNHPQQQFIQQKQPIHQDYFSKDTISSPRRQNQQNIYDKIIQINKQLQDYRPKQQKNYHLQDNNQFKHLQTTNYSRYNNYVTNNNSIINYQFVNNSHETRFNNMSVEDNKYEIKQNIQRNEEKNKKSSIDMRNQLNTNINTNLKVNSNLNHEYIQNNKNIDDAKIKILDYLQNKDIPHNRFSYLNHNNYDKKEKFNNIKQIIQQKISHFKQNSKSLNKNDYHFNNNVQNNDLYNKNVFNVNKKQTNDINEINNKNSQLELNDLNTQNSIKKDKNDQKIVEYSENEIKQNISYFSQQSSQISRSQHTNNQSVDVTNNSQQQQQVKMNEIFEKMQEMVNKFKEERREWKQKEQQYLQIIKQQREQLNQ